MAQQRTEFGFTRSTCACANCINNCHHMPGYLVPADIPRIAKHLGYMDVTEFARDSLLASPGALVMKDGEKFRIRTLVPARSESGACIFLKNNKCTIHPVSPFACAFFDEHEPQHLADRKSARGLVDIEIDSSNNGRYTRLWRLLDSENKRGVPPEVAREHLRESRV